MTSVKGDKADAPATRSRGFTIGRVSARKPQDLLADQLREAILQGEVVEGEALPPERELVERTGMTRGSIRSALRTLAAEGLVQTRPGRFGGNVVTLPGQDTIASSIGRFVRGRRLPLRTIHETRDALETALARLAAINRTPADLAQLHALHQDLIDAGDNFQKFARVNAEWHSAAARASGNIILSSMLNSISYGVAQSTSTEEYNTPETRSDVIRIHGRILEAIEAQDADAAERRMRRHIGATHARTKAPGDTEVPMSEDLGDAE